MMTVAQLKELVKAGDYAAVARAAAGGPIFADASVLSKGTSSLVSAGLRALASDQQSARLSDEVKANHLRCIEYLLMRYPPTPDELAPQYGGNLLELAVQTGRLDMVKLIYPRNPEIDVQRGVVLTDLARNGDSVPIYDFLLSRESIKTKHFDGSKADFMALAGTYAIHYGGEDVVRFLAGKGVDVTCPAPVDKYFKYHFSGKKDAVAYPIQFATSAKMVELLESLGAKLDAADPGINHGESALYSAVRFGVPQHVTYLLLRGLSVRHRNNDGKTPLHCAASSYKTTHKEVGLLLAAGAEVDAVDNDGNTALMECLLRGCNKAKLAALVKAGADPCARDNKGKHVLLTASETPVIEVLVSGILRDIADGKKMDSAAVSDFACHAAKKKMFKFALQLMACAAFDFKVRGGMDTTPVHEAAKVFKEAVVVETVLGIALSKGFGLESKNERGYTALMEAVSAKNVAMVQALINKGADIHAVTPAGKTAAKLTRNPELAAILYSQETADAVSNSVDNALENGVAGDTLGDAQPKRSKTNLSML